MKRLPILFLFTHALLVGCAGELTEQEKEKFLRGGSGAGGSAGGAIETGGSGPGPSTGTGGASGGTGGATTGTGGAGGGGPVDLCVVPIMKDKCAIAGCHGPAPAVADLVLTEAIVSQPSSLVDKPNVGQQNACAAGMAKLIDSAQPDKSLIYTKVTIPTCGSKMPVGTPLTPTEIACVLSWIKSAVPGGGTGGAGGAGGTGGTGGTGGSGGTSVDAGGARDGGRG